MRSPLLAPAACAALVLLTAVPPAIAADRITVTVRVEGTIPGPDDPTGKPFKKAPGPYPAWVPQQFAGGDLLVMVKDGKGTAIVAMSLGNDPKLKERAGALAGRRVVVEGTGEYRLHVGKVTMPGRQGTYEEDATYAHATLTVTRIEPAD